MASRKLDVAEQSVWIAFEVHVQRNTFWSAGVVEEGKCGHQGHLSTQVQSKPNVGAIPHQ
jgi:hypothetical protein